MPEITFLEAIRQGLREEMERDERVLLLGEDIGAYGGAFKVTEGLLERFGDARVIDTPISEAAIVGAAAGAQPVKAGVGKAKHAPRVNPIRTEQMRRRLRELEQQATNLEREIGLLEAQQAGSYHDHRESARLSKELDQRRAALNAVLGEWEQVGTALEQ